MTRLIPELRRPGHVGYRGLDAPDPCGCPACDALGRAMDADLLARRRVRELAAEVDRAHGLGRATGPVAYRTTSGPLGGPPSSFPAKPATSDTTPGPPADAGPEVIP